MDKKVSEAIKLIKRGEYSLAREQLVEIVKKNPDNELAWLWLTQVAKHDRERLIFLKRVLHINPQNVVARKGIRVLQERMGMGVPNVGQRNQETSSGVRPLRRRREPIQKNTESETQRKGAAGARFSSLGGVGGSKHSGKIIINRFERFVIHLQLSLRRGKTNWGIFSQNRLAVIGLAILVIYALMAIAHPLLMKYVWVHRVYDPITGYDMNIMHPSLPSLTHLLGTDRLGRDVLSMLLAATTPAFVIGITAALTTAFVGTFVAVVSAYFGGRIDSWITRVSDAFLLLPAPIFMIIVGVAFNEIKPVTLGVLFGIISGLGGAAITLRAYALTLMAKPYIEATKVAGGSSFQIIRRHLLPHMVPLAATLMLISVVGAVVADAFISFFGITRLYLNWGTMIYTSQAYGLLFGDIEWHVLIPPSIAISLFATSFYLIAQGLQEIADPKLQRR